LAGDEFAILSQKISQDEFIKLNQSIVDEFENCIFKIDGNEFNITVTIGVAFERDNLYVKAEMAMKNGKERNLNINFYETSIDIQKKYENNIKWTKKLKDAIKEDRIIAFIQPIINNKTGKIEKYESLVRLRELDGKIEPPFHFLEIAKKARQYPSITQKVLDKSIDFFADKDLEFSINLTIEDILNKDTRCYIKDKLISHNIANRVVLEIVESEGIENFDEVSKFIIEMKSIGCKIAIDDFGTGYSNFEYLMKLNVDYVKIDGSMIKSLDTDTNSQIVIALIVEFAQKLNIKTIAEFVHSEAVYNKVKEMGIDYSQGYHLGRPESIDE
jgi:EAL domain-containing protein (putative c-di-GMP-specific phosphodiesterase class I)